MKTTRILNRSIATFLALAPFAANAAPDTLSGASPAWGTAGAWSLNNFPLVGDNAIIAATGTVDVRGSTLTGFKEIQDITFNSTAAVTLINNSTSTNMLLALNGGRGAGVPLISTVGDIAYTITGVGTGTKTLGLELRASGDISVAANALAITSIISQNGGPRSINKTGAGRLTLGGANTYAGGTFVTAGILEATVNGALGAGPTVINGGTLEINFASATLTTTDIELNVGGQLATRGTATLNNSVTVNGGTLATRTNDTGTYAGTLNVVAPSFVNLRSYTTPTSDLNITISGVLTGSSPLTINGNATNATSGKALILTNTGTNYSGTYNVSARQALRNAPAATGRTIGTGTVNLNGGTLQLRDNGPGDGGTLAYGNNVVVSTGGGTIDVDHVGANLGNTFDLGTLTIGAQTLNSTGANSYFVRFTGATTLTGAATFHPTTAATVLGGAVGGGFDLTKTGIGVLRLDAASTYSGNTHVNEGTLVLNGSVTSSPRINVKAGATLDVTTAAGGFSLGGTQILSGDGAVTGVATVATGGRIEAGDATGAGTLTMSNLRFGTVLGDTATLVVSPSASALPVNVTALNGLVTNGGAGKVTINIGGGNPTIGIHPLVGYNNSVPIGSGKFVLGTLPTPRLLATLQDSGTSINLDVTGVDAPFWKGSPGTVWSNNPGATNWGINTGTGPATNFLVSDSVTFDDTATVTTVDVTAAVVPSEVKFLNGTKPYTVTGTQPIAGGTSLVKTGAAKVTIANLTNTFTGPVDISAGGIVSVPAVANNGSPSPLGAGTAVVLDDGTLEMTGTGSTDRTVTLGAGGGTLSATAGASLTITGVVSGSGLTKTGAGKVTLTTAANTYTTTTISGGILQIGDGLTNGTYGSAGTITDDATLAFNNPLAQTVAAEITGTGALTKTGAGILVLSGGVANSYAGTTTVSGGNLILSKTSGVNAVGGDVIVETGGTVSYGTTGGQLQDHIPDTASITINGGTFGSGAGDMQAGPTAGVTDTVLNVTVNSGTFLSGRNGAVTPFAITDPLANPLNGILKIAGGTALAQRGGRISADKVVFTGGSLNLDGGSGTGGQESRLNVGVGGLTMAGTTINFNAGPSTVAANSQGSIVALNGDVTSTGTSAFARLNAGVSNAVVDLGAAVRTFDVTGTLTIAPDMGALATDLGTAGVHKTGAGKLVLEGAQNYATLTNDAGRTDVLKTIGTGASTVTANAGEINFAASQTLASLTVATGATVTIGTPLPPAPPEAFAFETGTAAAAAVPEPGTAALLLGGLATLLGRRNGRRASRR